MVYKIYDLNANNTLEFSQNDQNELLIVITSLEDETYHEIIIDNSRLYKMLGALHFIQKEMPLFKPSKN